MSEVAAAIRHLLSDLLTRRSDVLLLACCQRAKWEGWLKFELAAALSQHPGVQDVVLEACYPSGRRSDISFSLNGIVWYMELKTPNVNWRAAGLENRTRPITRNIGSLMEDIKKLQRECDPRRGLAVFCLFPIPARIWDAEREKLNYHLGRVEAGCDLSAGSLSEAADFVSITNEFGICNIVVETASIVAGEA